MAPAQWLNSVLHARVYEKNTEELAELAKDEALGRIYAPFTEKAMGVRPNPTIFAGGKSAEL